VSVCVNSRLVCEERVARVQGRHGTWSVARVQGRHGTFLFHVYRAVKELGLRHVYRAVTDLDCHVEEGTPEGVREWGAEEDIWT
jgi:hypothetical protein